jgi:uncharacterized protein YigE (DUF2233 family)
MFRVVFTGTLAINFRVVLVYRTVNYIISRDPTNYYSFLSTFRNAAIYNLLFDNLLFVEPT